MPTGPVIRPNPQWVAQKGQLDELERQRSELLEKMTPAHPAVESLDEQIKRVQEHLGAIPDEMPIAHVESNAAANESNAAPAEKQPDSDETVKQAPGTDSVSPQIRQHYLDLLVAAGHARDAYRSAVDTESSVWNRIRSNDVQSIEVESSGSIDLSPYRGQSLPAPEFGRQIPIGAIVILTLFSLLAGVAAAVRVRGPHAMLMSTDEIEIALGLPVLGHIGPYSEDHRENAA